MEDPNTLFLGKDLRIFDKLDSTNAHLQDLIKSKQAAEGTVVWALEQTQGRGQMGTQWNSPAQVNLYFSILLCPRFLPVPKQFYLSKIAALALTETCRSLGVNEPFVKWPNDLLIQGKKAGGILIENQVRKSLLDHSIIGVGLNINQKVFPENLTHAHSLGLALGKELDLYQVLKIVLKHFESFYLQLKAAKWDHIDQAYLQSLYGYGQPISFTTNSGENCTATLMGVSPEGKILFSDNGKLKRYGFKEIRFNIYS